jgi:ATP-dependent DNA ligase
VICTKSEGALRLRKQSFVLDGEAVVLGLDGISDFDGLYSGKHNADVRQYAFDLLLDYMREEPCEQASYDSGRC